MDPFGGLADLGARRLTAVSERIFADDPLRLMRAARFAHVLGLEPALALREAVREQAGEVKRAAPERVATEMVLTLDAGRAGDAARLWQGLGLLAALIPERGQSEAEDALFAFLDHLEEVLAGTAGGLPSAAPLPARRLTETIDGAVQRRTALRLAGLLRGIEPGRAAKAGRRLKLSSSMISLIETAARMNLRGALPDVGQATGPGREAVLFLWASSPWEPEVILLAAAAAACAADSGGTAAVQALMAVWATRARDGVPRLPFDGNALMEELRLGPGPQLGTALRAARLAWESGEATSVEQALAAARDVLDVRNG